MPLRHNNLSQICLPIIDASEVEFYHSIYQRRGKVHAGLIQVFEFITCLFFPSNMYGYRRKSITLLYWRVRSELAWRHTYIITHIVFVIFIVHSCMLIFYFVSFI